jgi:hypothetical protein
VLNTCSSTQVSPTNIYTPKSHARYFLFSLQSRVYLTYYATVTQASASSLPKYFRSASYLWYVNNGHAMLTTSTVINILLNGHASSLPYGHVPHTIYRVLSIHAPHKSILYRHMIARRRMRAHCRFVTNSRRAARARENQISQMN